MLTKITFKKMDSSNALKKYIKKKLGKFDKMLDSPADAHVVLSIEKIRCIAEIKLTCDKLRIHAKEDSAKMRSSIDALIDKVKTQITKHKQKVRRHISKNKKSIKHN